MGTLILYTTLFGAVTAIVFPWIGAAFGYLSILLGPHILWWWSFEGTRHFQIIAICTLIGIFFSFFRKKISGYYLIGTPNFFLFIWFIFTVLSYYLGPYVSGGPGPRYFPPDYIFQIVLKSFGFYFLSVLCLDSETKIKWFSFIILFSSIYYIYWTNDRYLSGYYGIHGRIGGPQGLNANHYGDENNFAMFFVISLPFIYFIGYAIKNIFLRYLLWLTIPFGWHAIFLTGSRGGLLALLFSSIACFLLSPKKKIAMFVFPLLAAAFVLQGGDVLKNRTKIMTSSSLGQTEIDQSALGRLQAWHAATNMIIKHPVTGVGIASFGAAFPDFSNDSPRECHNTFFQIAAESGLIAMLGYVVFLIITLKKLWKQKKQSPDFPTEKTQHFNHLLRNAVFASWIGFITCALFLSLQVFEQFFYLAIISNFLIRKNQMVTLTIEKKDE
jgi:putative inorganic carbon (hco3(-)) transporter